MNEINYKLLQQVHQLKPIIRSKVIGVGSYLPKQRVKSDDIMTEIKTEEKYGLSHSWMSEKMGIIERRMVESSVQPSDLAIKAAENAFNGQPDFNVGLIDAVIFCGIERDMPEPATAHIVSHALGLRAQHVFDVSNACCGFFDGVKLASSLIESEIIKYALVVTGEVSTKVSRAVISQLKKGMSKEKAKHLWGTLSVGDAGGAMIIGHSPNPQSGFMKFNQGSESKLAGLCNYKWKNDGTVDAHMNMAQIVARGFKLHKRVYEETLDALNWTKFDWVLSHQTGATGFQHAMKIHNVGKERMIRTYPMLGNITTATLPISFQKLSSSANLKTGDKVGGLFAGSGLVVGQFGYVV